MSSSLKISAQYIVSFIKHQRQLQGAALRDGSSGLARPLMVSLQGPQGSGKSTLASAVQTLLGSQGIRTVITSLDDFYLPHAQLKALAVEYPENRLWHGRGQPGTHDTELLTNILRSLRDINEVEGKSVNLPIFDKSQFDGEGDRSDQFITVTSPVDVVIFEGWCVGLEPISEAELQERLRSPVPSQESSPPAYLQHSFESLQAVNTALTSFSSLIYSQTDALIALRPPTLDHIYAWRTQQENAMKSKNGGKGMTDEQVIKFVDRYMPLYELCGTDQEFEKIWSRWSGRGLELKFDEHRQVIDHRNV